MLEWVTTARKQKALEVKALAVHSSGQDTIIQSPIPNSSPRLWRIAAVILKFRDLSLALLVRSEVRRETFDGRFSPERRSNELDVLQLPITRLLGRCFGDSFVRHTERRDSQSAWDSRSGRSTILTRLHRHLQQAEWPHPRRDFCSTLLAYHQSPQPERC